MGHGHGRGFGNCTTDDGRLFRWNASAHTHIVVLRMSMSVCFGFCSQTHTRVLVEVLLIGSMRWLLAVGLASVFMKRNRIKTMANYIVKC